MTARSPRWLQRLSLTSEHGAALSLTQRLALAAAAVGTLVGWIGFMLWAPALLWTERPVPSDAIAVATWHVQAITLPMVLCALLTVAYLAVLWVIWTSRADLPAPVVVGVFAGSGLCAVLTYPAFAQDIYVILASVWSFTVVGLNPYEQTPSQAFSSSTANPYGPFIGNWAFVEYPYGPAWLLVGAVVMKALGSGVLVNVLATKVLMWVLLGLMGWLAWRLARARGWAKPMALAAVVLWNPALLTEGVMTPHLDLPMAAALLAAVVAWRERSEWDALITFTLSISAKLVTAMLAPAILVGLMAAGALRGPRGRVLLGTVAALALLTALLWPGVWGPFLDRGLRGSLDIVSGPAFLPNLVRALESVGMIAPAEARDAGAVAKSLRWLVFVPLWLAGTAACAVLAFRRPRHLPDVLVEPFALLLLAYHVAFTLWVLPWHFTTALVLCLVAPSRWGIAAGLLITLSVQLYNVNAQWVWSYLTSGDGRWLPWTLALSLMSGPVIGMSLLGWHTWLLIARPVGSSAPPWHTPSTSAPATSV
jgi:hypothetical protein